MRQSKEEKEKQDRIAGGFAIGIIAILIGLTNLAFIIPDLVFAHQQSDCVRSAVPNISLTLDTWLKVDAFVRIGLMVTLLIIAIFFCISQNIGPFLLLLYLFFMVITSLFFFAWTIVGAVMFWGHLNPSGTCSGGVQIYMHVILIFTFVAVFCNCMSSWGK